MNTAVWALALALLLGLAAWIVKRRARQRKNAFLKKHGGKACPQCRQYVSGVAWVCRHCGYRFDDDAS